MKKMINYYLSKFNRLNSVKKVRALSIGLLVLIAFVFLANIWSIVYLPKEFYSDQTSVFIIKKGESIKNISQNLEEEGIIKSALFFNYYVRFKGISGGLQAGTYEVSPAMNIPKIARKFFKGDSIQKKLILVEGWTLDQIISYLEKEEVYSRNQILEAFSSEEVEEYISQHSYFNDKVKELNFEGYFFPDTYQISLDASPEEFIIKVFSNFDSKINKIELDVISQNKSIMEIITMASIIEKEVKAFEDKRIVSGILWKRMEIGMPLQADATLLYQKQLYQNRVLIKHTKEDSPYNTYTRKGLPYGPISNPGIESIKAAVYPQESSYFYYLSAPNGQTIFSENFEQHKQAKFKYLR